MREAILHSQFSILRQRGTFASVSLCQRIENAEWKMTEGKARTKTKSLLLTVATTLVLALLRASQLFSDGSHDGLYVVAFVKALAVGALF